MTWLFTKAYRLFPTRMSEPSLARPNAATPGWPAAASSESPVPARYFGVWSRTLLETPGTCDTDTMVRWMQLGQWHVDLRVPQSRPGELQGFSGITHVRQVAPNQTELTEIQGVMQKVSREICTWQRVVDLQPKGGAADEGWMEFETSQRLLETGIHSKYFEVWERLPGSTGRRIALAEPARADGKPSARLFVSGDYLMRVRPAAPRDRTFEISFGKFADGHFCIEASSIPALAGSRVAMAFVQVDSATAEVSEGSARGVWTVLEWVET